MALSKTRIIKRELSTSVRVVLVFGLGIVAGTLSIRLFPEMYLKVEWHRVLNLFLSPVIIGSLMALIGKIRARHDRPEVFLERFSYGALFAFAFAVMRFFFTKQ